MLAARVSGAGTLAADTRDRDRRRRFGPTKQITFARPTTPQHVFKVPQVWQDGVFRWVFPAFFDLIFVLLGRDGDLRFSTTRSSFVFGACFTVLWRWSPFIHSFIHFMSNPPICIQNGSCPSIEKEVHTFSIRLCRVTENLTFLYVCMHFCLLLCFYFDNILTYNGVLKVSVY